MIKDEKLLDAILEEVKLGRVNQNQDGNHS